jgi:hypothetical protein
MSLSLERFDGTTDTTISKSIIAGVSGFFARALAKSFSGVDETEANIFGVFAGTSVYRLLGEFGFGVRKAAEKSIDSFVKQLVEFDNSVDGAAYQRFEKHVRDIGNEVEEQLMHRIRSMGKLLVEPGDRIPQLEAERDSLMAALESQKIFDARLDAVVHRVRGEVA